jgi:parallel beta-helix repeat protein
VEDNTVNGKPLVYLEDASNYKVEDAGQVVLVNCNNITVENLDLSNTSIGLELWMTDDSKVLNNIVSNNNRGGICLDYSSNNTITGNNASNNYNFGNNRQQCQQQQQGRHPPRLFQQQQNLLQQFHKQHI